MTLQEQEASSDFDSIVTKMALQPLAFITKEFAIIAKEVEFYYEGL